jgi:iron complex transport system ATP-binding protein
MALAQEPALLLLDEPTAHLDVHHQMALLAVVRRLHLEHGITVLAAVHDLNLAALWFDRLLLLDERRIVADGAPETVLRPDLLQRVFRTPVHLLRHPTENVPLVVLEKGKAQST